MIGRRSELRTFDYGNNVRIQAQSGVGRNVKDEEVLQGSPTFGYNDYSKSYVHFKTYRKSLQN
jgi:UDP-3-O-[3-hydroxymyristoyl] glucosamine N-acyltransferase